MSFKDFVGEFLSFLEQQEARLLSWGFYDFAYSTSEVEELFQNFASDELKEFWSKFKTELTFDELLDEMEYAKLLYRPDENEYLYRTRFAEGVRLFARLRQMFKDKDWATGANLVSDIKLHLAPRRYPNRDQFAAECWNDLQPICRNEIIQKEAFEALTTNSEGKSMTFARFQRDAFARILQNYQGTGLTGTVVSAGTGAGKTKAFYIPALIGAIGELISNAKPFVKIIAIYPRNVLLADQLREALSEAAKLSKVIKKHELRPLRFGALLGFTPNENDFNPVENGKTRAETQRNWKRRGNGFIVPFIKSPVDSTQDLIWRDEDRIRGNTRLFRADGDSQEPDIEDGVLILTREELRRNPPDIFFLSAEMLNRELGNPNWDKVFGINQKEYNPRLLLLDEVHAYEGLHGAQIAWLLRRWRFWSKNPNQHIVGLSATLKEAPKHLATLVGISDSAVQEFKPTEAELEYKGIEYNLAVKGDPVSGASLLATSIQTAMLTTRLLTPRSEAKIDESDDKIKQSDFYGRKAFGFTDNLDSLNRWYSDTHDAETNKRLARLRLKPNLRRPPITVEPQIITKIQEAGQIWELPRQLGFNLESALKISRCSSQDPGANVGSDLIVASASLEVGFDDPEVGAVLHHKKPISMSSFIQRKGRAGRRRGMRPLTVVILSDYGGDRWAFQNAERLFQPEIDNIFLPLVNSSVLKIQATLFLLEWVGRRINEKQSRDQQNPYIYFSTPASEKAFNWRRNWLSSAKIILKDFLKQGDYWHEFRRDFVYLFSHPDKSDKRKLGNAELDSILWESPRPILRHAVPTLLRQIEAEWKLAKDETQFENAGVSYPLPQFLPSATFAELGGVGVRLVFSEEPDKDDEYLSASRALFETCPGRVSKRYALRLQEEGFWHFFSEQILTAENPFLKVSVKKLFPNCLFIKNLDSVLVHQPTVIELKHRPVNVLDTSNANWNWQSFLKPRSSGITLPIFLGKVWANLIDDCEVHLHRAYSHIDVNRYAQSCEYDIRLDKGGSIRGSIVLGSSEEKDDEAIGFALQADGIALKLKAEHINETHHLTPEQVARFRPHFYLDALKFCPFIHERMNNFLVEWMWQTSVAMLAATIVKNRCSFSEAQNLLAANRPQAAGKVLDSIFQISNAISESEESQMRLKHLIMEQWGDASVVARFCELERLLWENLGDGFDEWVKKRYVATIAQAFRNSVVAQVADVSEDDLAVDVVWDNDGAAQIFLTELNSGGLGQIELIIKNLRESPDKFLEAMRHSMTYCPRNSVRQGLTDTLESIVKHNENQSELESALSQIRLAKGFKAQDQAKNALQNTLENAGLPASRTAVVTLVTKLLRPGSSANTDAAMYLLNKLWHRTEKRLGIEIDARVFAYLCSQRTSVKRRVVRLLREIGDEQDPSPAQIYSVIQQFLLLDCLDSCPECLDNPNLYNNFGKPSRSLARAKLNLDSTEILIDDKTKNWLDLARQFLRDEGRVQLTTDGNNLNRVIKTLQGLLAEEIEVGYLLLPVSIANVTRNSDKWRIELQLRGFGSGI